MDRDSLYLLVTEAIERAESLENLGAPGAHQAHLDVSLIEERIAAIVPASEVEGAVARRGAVRHAIAAGVHSRAEDLMRRFTAENEAPHELQEELGEILAAADAAIGVRYPQAVARFGLSEIRRVAAEFHDQGMPFPVPA